MSHNEKNNNIFSKMQGIIKEMECYLGSFQAHFTIIPNTTRWFLVQMNQKCLLDQFFIMSGYFNHSDVAKHDQSFRVNIF
jgi:hypothetical protein